MYRGTAWTKAQNLMMRKMRVETAAAGQRSPGKTGLPRMARTPKRLSLGEPVEPFGPFAPRCCCSAVLAPPASVCRTAYHRPEQSLLAPERSRAPEPKSSTACVMWRIGSWLGQCAACSPRLCAYQCKNHTCGVCVPRSLCVGCRACTDCRRYARSQPDGSSSPLPVPSSPFCERTLAH